MQKFLGKRLRSPEIDIMTNTCLPPMPFRFISNSHGKIRVKSTRIVKKPFKKFNPQWYLWWVNEWMSYTCKYNVLLLNEKYSYPVPRFPQVIICNHVTVKHANYCTDIWRNLIIIISLDSSNSELEPQKHTMMIDVPSLSRCKVRCKHMTKSGERDF